MSNGNERTNTGEANIINFTDAAKVPQQHGNWEAKQAPQIAISNWVNSCGRQDDMTIEDIVDACWLLQPVVDYLAEPVATTVLVGSRPLADFRKQLVRMYIRQALMSYIDAVVVASVPKD